MRTERTSAILYGPSESSQSVDIEYTIETVNGFFEPVWFLVTECKVLSEIEIECGDLYEDVMSGIRFNEGLASCVVRMEGDIQTTNLKPVPC